MSTTIGAARVSLSANAAQLSEGFQQARAAVGDYRRSIQRAQRDLRRKGRQLERFGKTATRNISTPLMAAGGAAVAAGAKFASTADEIDKASQKAGIGAEQYQELRFAFDQLGVSSENFEKMMGRLDQRMGMAAEGNDKYREALNNLNISTKELEEGTLESDEALNRIFDSLTQIEDPQRRVARATELFGTRLTRELRPALESGSAGLEELRQQARDAGIVMSGDSVQAGAALNDAMSEIRDATRAAGLELAEQMVPALETAADFMRDRAIPAIRAASGAVGDAVAWFRNLDESTQMAIGAVAGLAAAIGPLTVVMGKALGVVAALLSPLALKIGLFGAIAAAVVYVIDNWEALIERFSDINWWRNALIDMAQFAMKWSPINLIIEQFNNLLERFGRATIPNPYEGISDQLEELRGEQKEYEHEFDGFSEFMGRQMSRIGDGVGALRDRFGNMFDTASEGAGKTADATGEMADRGERNFERMARAGEHMNSRIASAMASMRTEMTRDFDTVDSGNPLDHMTEGMDDTLQKWEGFWNSVARAVENGMENATIAFAQGIGQMAAGQASLSDIGRAIMQTMFDMAERVGRIAVGVGISIEGIRKALTTLNPITAIAAGTALIAVASAARSALQNAADAGGSGGGSMDVPALATGGAVSGPTLALVGDNPNAHIDPEVVAPASQIQSLVDGGSKGELTGELRADGSQLVALVKQTERKERRSGKR